MLTRLTSQNIFHSSLWIPDSLFYHNPSRSNKFLFSLLCGASKSFIWGFIFIYFGVRILAAKIRGKLLVGVTLCLRKILVAENYWIPLKNQPIFLFSSRWDSFKLLFGMNSLIGLRTVWNDFSVVLRTKRNEVSDRIGYWQLVKEIQF